MVGVLRVRRMGGRRRRRLGDALARAGEERGERVGAAFHLLDASAFDGAEVDDAAIGGRDLGGDETVS